MYREGDIADAMTETKVATGAWITFEHQVFDKDGNPVKIWQENFLGRFIRQRFGKDIQGPWILGKWTTTMRNKVWQRF